MKAELSVIMFDFDGVIVDSGEDMVDAVNFTLQRFNREKLPDTTILNYIGKGSRTLLRKSFGLSQDDEIDEIYPVYMEYYLEHCVEKTKLFPDVRETLKNLRDMGIKCAVVTNKPEFIADKILDELEIAEYVDLLLGAESVKALKPDPEGINAVLKHFEINPEDAMIVGDSYTDILAGRAAEVWTCGVTYGIGDTRRLLEAEPDLVVDDIKELSDLVTFSE